MHNIEWNVYVEGKYVGTVQASTEDSARCAALSRFDLNGEVALSVHPR
jgi:hypothetical protein